MLHPDRAAWANPIKPHFGGLRSFVINSHEKARLLGRGEETLDVLPSLHPPPVRG
ncbi:hypothetical protein ACFV98_40995 [Streptomyces violascens]|uniref:hypothetical protein n=1 Tax=Streptomyces violascens TaxID=67381 RepID=UPI00365756D3